MLLLTLGLITLSAGAAEVFRWVDDSGQVHYSDRPMEGAERVHIEDAQAFKVPAAERRAKVEDSDGPAAAFNYETLEIASPRQEEVLWNIEGQLEVSMQLRPQLQTGHRVELYLDDRRVEGMRRGSLQASLTDVSRGVHTLRAEVRDQTGTVMIRSDVRTFAVQQTSIANPVNPVQNPPPALPPRPTPRRN